MSPKANKRNLNKRKGRRVHPLDRDRLIMDSIYNSKSFEVQNCYRQVMKEEDTRLREHLAREEMWVLEDHLDRVHMRMGVRFFHMLSPTMQKHFMTEYPNAFTMFAEETTAAPVLAKAV